MLRRVITRCALFFVPLLLDALLLGLEKWARTKRWQGNRPQLPREEEDRII